jgi:hypothetical protein
MGVIRARLSCVLSALIKLADRNMQHILRRLIRLPPCPDAWHPKPRRELIRLSHLRMPTTQQ